MTFTKDEKIVLIITAVYTLAATMATTFINVYLFDYTNSYIVLNIYQMVRLGMLGIVAVISAKLSYRLRMSVTLTIGLICITLSVMVLLILQERVADNMLYVYLIALIWGSGEGFFWISLNTLNQLITSPVTRGNYLGVNGAVTNIATILAPLFSAQILAMYTIEIDGYYMMFKFVIVMFILISILSMLIKSPVEKKTFSVIKTIFEGRHDLQWNYVIRTQFCWGVRDAAVMSLTGILIYQAVGNGTAYGRLLAVFAIVATISNYIVGKIVRKNNRIFYLAIGATGLFISGMSLVVIPGIAGAITHGMLANLFFAFMSIPYSIIAMNIISDYMKNENVIGRTTCREVMTATGRVFGLAILVLIITLFDGTTGLKAALIVLYCFNLLIGLSTIEYNHKKHPKILKNVQE